MKKELQEFTFNNRDFLQRFINNNKKLDVTTPVNVATVQGFMRAHMPKD